MLARLAAQRQVRSSVLSCSPDQVLNMRTAIVLTVAAFLHHVHGFLIYPPKSINRALFMGRRTFGGPKIMPNAIVDFRNFWIRSIANFTICERPQRDPDHVSFSGSLYWDEGDYVVRYSDHWSGEFGVTYIRKCRWYLSDYQRPMKNLDVAARCDYKNFGVIRKESMKKRKKWSQRKR
jgi:hypothetical protein